ncbi:MAG: HD domain-containing protein [Treponema sp.]|jgi:poly(A) polymerase|nr:HD domain-containing protein [Treponema sp.]
METGTTPAEPAVFETLANNGYSLKFCSFSALDLYWRHTPLPFVRVETDADISALARLFENLRFPGVGIADAALDQGEKRWYFCCLDDEPDTAFSRGREKQPAYRLLSFFRDAAENRFWDPLGLYPLLRELRDGPRDRSGQKSPAETGCWWKDINPSSGRYRAIMEGALILARYSSADERPGESRIIRELARTSENFAEDLPPCAEAQQVLLESLMLSPRPDLGLELLKAAGFVERFWPELAALDNVDHSKEHHPEGNVWKHTLETFRYRKKYDPILSLGLLLHDVGKPLSESSGQRRFDGHAELGACLAGKFLKRLGFSGAAAGAVCWLVKNHMLPAALPRLPLSKTEEVLESGLFPTLLELYRCDESSSFKGLNGYYESSAAYQTYLRNRRNPYRSADGRKQAYSSSSPGKR